MYFLKINDEELPVPGYYSVDADDIDSTDSRRSDETGQMHRRRIRAGVKTVTVKWKLNGGQARELLELLSEPVLQVSMLDTAGEGCCECDMYASELKSVFYQQQNADADSSFWEVSCRLIEY